MSSIIYGDMDQPQISINGNQVLYVALCLFGAVIVMFMGFDLFTSDDSDVAGDTTDITDDTIYTHIDTVDYGIYNRFNIIEALCRWLRQCLEDIGLNQDIIDQALDRLRVIDDNVKLTLRDAMDNLMLSREIKKDVKSLAGDVQDLKRGMAKASATVTGGRAGTDVGLLDKFAEMMQASETRIIKANKRNINEHLTAITVGYRALEKEVLMLRNQSATATEQRALIEEMGQVCEDGVIHRTEGLIHNELRPFANQLQTMATKQTKLEVSQGELKTMVTSANTFNTNLAKRLEGMSDEIIQQVLEAIKVAQTEQKEACASKTLIKCTLSQIQALSSSPSPVPTKKSIQSQSTPATTSDSWADEVEDALAEPVTTQTGTSTPPVTAKASEAPAGTLNSHVPAATKDSKEPVGEKDGEQVVGTKDTEAPASETKMVVPVIQSTATKPVTASEQSPVIVPIVKPVDTAPLVVGPPVVTSVEKVNAEAKQAFKKQDDKTSPPPGHEKVEEKKTTDEVPAKSKKKMGLLGSVHAQPDFKVPDRGSHAETEAVRNQGLVFLEQIAKKPEQEPKEKTKAEAEDKAEVKAEDKAEEKEEVENKTKLCRKCEKQIPKDDFSKHHQTCMQKKCRNCEKFFDHKYLLNVHNKTCPRIDGSKKIQSRTSNPVQQPKVGQTPPKGPAGYKPKLKPQVKPLTPGASPFTPKAYTSRLVTADATPDNKDHRPAQHYGSDWGNSAPNSTMGGEQGNGTAAKESTVEKTGGLANSKWSGDSDKKIETPSTEKKVGLTGKNPYM